MDHVHCTEHHTTITPCPYCEALYLYETGGDDATPPGDLPPFGLDPEPLPPPDEPE